MKKLFSSGIVIALALLIVAGCGKNADVKLLEKAKNYEANEQFNQAISSYEKILSKYPESPLCAEALYRVGQVYTNGMQSFDSAITTFKEVMDTYPDNPYCAHAQFMIGFIYANSLQDTTNARSAYETFLLNYPEHELAPSVEWELKYLGKDINEIPELQQKDTATE